MKKIFLAVLFLVGCDDPQVNLSDVQPLPVTRPYVKVIGDSNCDMDYNNFYVAYEELGFNIDDCTAGHRITNKEPSRYWTPENTVVKTVILDRGINDARVNEPIKDFEGRVDEYVKHFASIRLICVLPVSKRDDIDAEPYRQVMIKKCPEYIDPFDYGVQLQQDGIHRTKNDNDLFMPAFGGL